MVDPKYLNSTNFSIHLFICLALILKHLSYPQQFHSSSRQSIPPCISTCLLHSWDILSLSNVVLASLHIHISTGISGLTALSFITLFIAAPTSFLLILWASWFSIFSPSAFPFLSFSHCFLCKMYVKSESIDANYLTSITTSLTRSSSELIPSVIPPPA